MLKFSVDGQAFTPVPTIFLQKFMCDAPQDYVKVYLFGLCLAYTGEQMDDTEMEERLHMTAEQIEAGLEYWAKKGFVAKRQSGKSVTYGFLQEQQEPPAQKAQKKQPPLYQMEGYNNILSKLFRREITTSELQKIYDFTDVFGLPQNVVITLIEYCFIVGGDKVNIAYIDAVAQKWAEDGINTQELAQQRIEEYKAASSGAKKVMKQMGVIGKNPGKTELDLYDKWTEKWGFTLESILYAMRDKEFASVAQPFKYLDGILNTLQQSGATTSRKISEYNSIRDRKREELKEIFTTLGYTSKSSTPRHEQYYDGWKAAGYPQSMILTACEQTVNRGYKRFEAVDALLGEWNALGLDTEEKIQNHVQRQDELKERVQQVFECAGIKKPISDADRKTYLAYVNENKMSHDVLMYAAEISSISAAEPLPYMRKILQEWAKCGVTTLDMAKQQDINHTAAVRRDDKKAFEQREYTAEEMEQRKLEIVKDMERLYEE